MQSYFQPALQGDIASYTSFPKWHVSSAALAGGPSAQSPVGRCSPLEFPSKCSQLAVRKAVVAGSIPRHAEGNQDSCLLPVSATAVPCSLTWVERTTKTNSNLTLREALPMDMMRVQHRPFASPPSRATVEEHLAFGDDW